MNHTNPNINPKAFSLNDAKDQWFQVFDHVPVGLVVWEPSGFVSRSNRHFTKMFGYKEDEIPEAEVWFEKVYPDARYRKEIKRQWFAGIEKYVQDGIKFEPIEANVRCKDGSYKHVEFGFETIGDKFLTTFTDITKNVQAEQMLERIINGLPGIYFLYEAVDNDARLIGWNKNHETAFGYSSEELLGMSPFQLVKHKKDKDKIEFNLEQVAKGKEVSFEVGIAHKRGNITPYSIHATAIIDEDRHLFFGFGIDISRRLKVQEDLKRSERIFRAFMDNIPVYAYMKNDKFEHTYENQKVRSLGPTEGKSVRATDIFDLKTARLIESADLRIISKESAHTEIEYEANFHGNKRWLRDIKFELPIQGEQAALGGVAFDITEIKRYQKDLEKHKNELEELVQSRTKELEIATIKLETLNKKLYKTNRDLKDRQKKLESTLNHLYRTQEKLIQTEKKASLAVVTAGIAHEINNPLNFIQGSIQVLNDQIKSGGSKPQMPLEKLLENINVGVNRISQIVKSLNHLNLDNSQADSRVHIIPLLAESLTEARDEADHELVITTNFDAATDSVMGNPKNLHQAFYNILKNSYEATQPKDTIHIDIQNRGGHVEIDIVDTGRGIPESHVHRVTDPFFSTKEAGHGVGLGLSIAESIIKSHQGELLISSSHQKETKLTIRIPTC